MGHQRLHNLDDQLSRLRCVGDRNRYYELGIRSQFRRVSDEIGKHFQHTYASRRPISGQIYSLFDNEPARPPVPNYALPDCYRVSNVAQLDSKLGNFNDEALMFMFYSNPGGLQQIMAAAEL